MNALKLSTVLALLTFTGICRADPFDTWTWLSPNPPLVSLYSIAYGNGQFVAVGGTILTSADGTNWVDRHCLPAPGFLRAVTYGGGVFAAVGDSGNIVTSSNGVSWTQRQSGIEDERSSIAYGNGRFVTTGDGGTILTSVDGINWTRSYSPEKVWGMTVAFGEDQFVAVASAAEGSDPVIILSSVDGMNWVQRQPGTTNGLFLPDIAYGRGPFVGVGYTEDGSGIFMTSPDGVNWVQQESSVLRAIGLLRTIVYDNGRFVAVGYSNSSDSSSIATSTNGVDWVEHSITNTFDTGINFGLYSVAYGGGQFVAVGDFGAILNSVDGVTWTPTPRTSALWPERIAYGMGQFVGVTGDTILSSTDGGDWSPRLSLTNFRATCIAYGDGRFVVPFVGESDKGLAGLTFATSTNGLDWIQSTQLVNLPFVGAIAYGNGQFVALMGYVDGFAAMSIASSIDGVNWTWRQSGTTDSLTSITYGNGQFVAVGGGVEKRGGFCDLSGPSTIITSADGVNWIPRAPAITYFLYDVTYGNGQFVAVGGHDPLSDTCSLDVGSVITSTDGVNWVLRLSQVPGGLRQVAYGNGQFVARGGAIVTSRDGVNWTTLRPPQEQGSSEIFYIDGHFIASGTFGTLESDSVIDLSLISSASNGRLSLSLEGPTGLAYTIESSTNLISWQTLTNLTSAQPTTIILDPIRATSEPLFYRAYSQ